MSRSNLVKIATTSEIEQYVGKTCVQADHRFRWEFRTGEREGVNGDDLFVNFLLYKIQDRDEIATIHDIFAVREAKDYSGVPCPHGGSTGMVWHYLNSKAIGQRNGYIDPRIIITTPDLASEVSSMVSGLEVACEPLYANLAEGDTVGIFTGNGSGSIPTVQNYNGKIIHMEQFRALVETHAGRNTFDLSRLTKLGYKPGDGSRPGKVDERLV